MRRSLHDQRLHPAWMPPGKRPDRLAHRVSDYDHAVRSDLVKQRGGIVGGTAVYDDTGALVAGGVSEYEHDLREHAAAA